MTVVVDTSVLIDVLRDRPGAADVLAHALRDGELHASEVTRLEVLAGMRLREAERTRSLLAQLAWHDLDERIAETAGELGRRWLPSHRGIGAADLAVAATAVALGARVLTLNVKHFPMFEGLAAPY